MRAAQALMNSSFFGAVLKILRLPSTAAPNSNGFSIGGTSEAILISGNQT
jgi:hypothetical protein